ncbi:MAG: tellurite resistance TerB family protein [Rhodospirillales bacterium]|nr:tellurite resistance TerB family protein [Rhodospirillales bacterium]
MSGFLNILINHHKKNKLRAQNFFFMKACMAAAAAVAIADGIACRREVLAAKTLMDRLDSLHLFDPRHGVEIYTDYVSKIEKSAEQGRVAVREAIKPLQNDAELTHLLVMICHTISEADGIVRVEEVDAIDDICGYLGIDRNVVNAIEINMREQLLK